METVGIAWSVGPKALHYESLEPEGKGPSTTGTCACEGCQ